MVVDDVCAACICVGLCVLEVFQPPRPPKSAGTKPPLLDFACYATPYAQNSTRICSLQLMLLSIMPKKPIYAVVRAIIMDQGLNNGEMVSNRLGGNIVYNFHRV